MHYTNLFFFFNPEKSWSLCYSGPANHPHNPSEKSAVGARVLRREAAFPGPGLRGASARVGRTGGGVRAPRPDLQGGLLGNAAGWEGAFPATEPLSS